MHRRRLVSGFVLAVILAAAFVWPVVNPASAAPLQQAFRKLGQTFISTVATGAAFDVDQRGAGSIATFRDGGTAEYTFDQSSATFLNQLNMTGALNIDGAVDLDGVITNAEDLEHIGVMTHVTTAFTYTAAAGGTVTLATIGAGEEWLVHNVYIEVTSNFNCTGDDCTLVIGDGNDADGFCVLADAELQAADTEGTGWSAGWQCQVAATRGVYQDGTGGFMYDEASTETIDAVISEASGTTLSGGAATAHIFYTRLP